MDSKLTKSAAKKLNLRDIALDSSSLSRNKDIDPLIFPYRVAKKISLPVVKAEVLSFTNESDEEIRILRTNIDFSIKGFRDSRQDLGDEQSVELFDICARYRVDYTMLKELTDDEIKEFSVFNAVHNAWPFWRQHVYYLVSNAKLPNVVIPFFRPTQSGKKKKKARRKIRAKK